MMLEALHDTSTDTARSVVLMAYLVWQLCKNC
jgi:hypothetical protein